MSRPGSRLYTLLDAAVGGARVEDFGTAGVGLVEAERRGLPVVESWLLSASPFREAVVALPPGHDPASLLRVIHKPSGREKAARARERLRQTALSAELRSELAALCQRLAPDDWGFALRASPTLADPSMAELAGLDRVELGLRDPEALERGIALLWSAAVDEDALVALRDQRLRDLAMAVVIQRLEPAQSSAILLSREARGPAGDESFLLAASVGLGSPVVDGARPMDFVRVAADGSALARRLAHKPGALVVGAAGAEVVAAAAPDEPAIGDRALRKASELWKKLDRSRVEELELAFAADTPRVLSARASRGAGYPKGGASDSVWSRTGLADLLPGVPTPLSASLVEDFVEESLRKTLGDLGAEVERDAALVARVHGRHYLNVSAMVPALSGVPGIEPAVVVDLLRGGNKAEVARTLDVRSRRGSLAALSFAAARLTLQERRLTDAHLKFERDADQHRRWLAEMDLAILPDDALVTTLRESHGFLEATGRMLLSCSVVALASHLALQAALARVLPEAASRLAYSLTSGLGEVESARPALALAHVVELLRAEGVTSVEELGDGAGRRALSSWLEAFGDRGLCEVEAMTPRFGEDRAPVLRMLSAGLAAQAIDPDAVMRRVRVAADRDLAVVEANAGQVELAVIRLLLSRARALSKLRERMRVWMARTIAMTRTVALDVDHRLRRLDSALGPDSVFFLQHAELVSATGRTRADLGALVRMRRDAYTRGLARPDPPDTFIGSPPRVAPLPFDARSASGAGASGGVVTGRVRLLGSDGRGAERIAPGDVLVMRTPDVGLAPLFFWGAALIADAGSALSHAAVVAREIGIPAVFGVLGASVTLRDGEQVKVDGDRGLVERLDA